jgi:cytochrome c553
MIAWTRLPPARALVVSGGLILAGVACVAAVVVLSGAYNVAASARHFAITDWLIKLVLRRSIDTHSAGIEVPPLDEPGLARLGGLAFVTGCEPCHGGPGRPQGPIVAAMYPAPPPLPGKVDDWSDAELYWIVRHGLKFTGMPQWTGSGRADEVWPVVAFLRELPRMTPAAYRELAAAAAGAETVDPPPESADLAACAACHGDARRPPISRRVPPLQGQNAAYLVRALTEYAQDWRQSGIMEPLAAALSAERRTELAAAYAAMPLTATPAIGLASAEPAAGEGADAVPAGDAGQGRRIAEEGVPERNVPACLGCHSGERSPQFPRLAGLSAAYIAEQLRLFRAGVRGATTHGAIMQTVARRLPEEDVDAVADYLGRLGPRPVAAAAEAAAR